MPNPSLRGLQAFEAIGRCGTVTAAAEDLGVSPGAVSQLVRNLEHCLGLTLLERRGRRVELSSWGRLYYREVAKGFQQLSHAANVLTRARNETGIVLSALTSVANKWVNRKIFDWQTLCPESSVRILGQEQEPRIGADQVDFRITYGRRSYVHEHVATLFTDWMVPACSPTLLAGRSLETPRDILTFPLLHVEWEADYKASPQWNDWATLVHADGAKKFSGLSFTLSSSAIDAAVNKRGVVLAQMSMIADELEAQTLVIPVDIRIALRESYFLAWDRTALQKPHGREFRDWLVVISRHQALASAPKPTL